jgi:hypothetical protein
MTPSDRYRHKINARIVLFDEAEVTALIDSARVVTLGTSRLPHE